MYPVEDYSDAINGIAKEAWANEHSENYEYSLVNVLRCDVSVSHSDHGCQSEIDGYDVTTEPIHRDTVSFYNPVFLLMIFRNNSDDMPDTGVYVGE